MTKITILPGDGIGPEITNSVLKILDHLNLDLEYDFQLMGITALNQTNTLIPTTTINSIKTNQVVLKAPHATPIGEGFRSVNVQMRLLCDLYANIRPIISIPGINSRYDNVNLVIFRENTEDLYVGQETVISDNEVHALKIITKTASERIINAAFQYALKHQLTHVTCVHKANILKLTDGMFLNCFKNIASNYPTIQADDLIVDNACLQLVKDPTRYQVMVMPNLYGDILSDLASGLIGGLGLAPSANIGPAIAIFEAVHGTAPDIANQDLANPSALLLSAIMMLEHCKYYQASQQLQEALYTVLANPQHHPQDLGGTCSLSQFTQAIINELTKKTAT
jgi:isocitrate dehydrogenase (NAD+)